MGGGASIAHRCAAGATRAWRGARGGGPKGGGAPASAGVAGDSGLQDASSNLGAHGNVMLVEGLEHQTRQDPGACSGGSCPATCRAAQSAGGQHCCRSSVNCRSSFPLSLHSSTMAPLSRRHCSQHMAAAAGMPASIPWHTHLRHILRRTVQTMPRKQLHIIR